MNTEKIEPTLDWLENPEIFRVNRIDAHSDHLFYENVEDTLLGYNMPLKQSLNGKWMFSYAKNPYRREKDFYKLDYDCSTFHYINVPGHIQMQGYDKCQYINTMYPWDGVEELRPPYISKEDNPVGSYVKYFNINEELKNKRIFISFQGVETAFYIWVNGEFVGYSEDTFTPSEFEITDYIKENEENKLAVEVYKRSSASWIEDQDFWRFSGIFREVYLYGIPKVHIRDLFVKSTLDKEYKKEISEAEIKQWLIELAAMGPKIVIATSVPDEDSHSTDRKTNVVAYDRENDVFWKVSCKYIPASYPGTGDAYTSVVIGSLLQGDSLPIAIERGVQFITQCILASYGFKYPNREGVLLERMLDVLKMPTISNSYELLKNEK